ncbi:3-oxo-tetronate 4-phosphate decarboxylase [Aquamicrobium terrae]|uniref:3-oxo-tetronate 4-phosphate decarboxylase n=1 Tax=Aquamicrobium terrae TaxID=1324945 RepID=A0ABV2N6V0_9HYPH
MNAESRLRENLARFAKSLFDRGFSVGSAGNISAALDDGFLMTPTNSCLGFLDPARISKLDAGWRHVSGDRPSKEAFLHRAFFETRPQTGAVVHLHSTFATALSCMADVDPENCIPAMTPYVVMRVGQVKLLSYFRPGDECAGDLVRGLGGKHAAVLLANHGPVVSGRDLPSAVFAAEELEESAKLAVILRNERVRYLTPTEVEDLKTAFPIG